MTPYRHRHQRVAHRFRYGYAHWKQHHDHQTHHHGAPVEGIDWRAWKVAGTGLFVLAVLVVIVFGVLAFRDIVRAQHSMDAARATISAAVDNRQELTSPAGRAQAEVDIIAVQSDADTADSILNNSFALGAFGSIPGLHGQIQGLLQLVEDVGQTATLASGLLQQVNTLAASTQGLTLSIPQLQSLQSSVASAHAQLASFNRPSGGLWGPLGSARASFDTEDARLTALLGTGSSVLSYALPLVGADGPRLYLIAGENNAEMRDQGEVLSNALMHSANGSFSLDDTASLDTPLAQPVDVPLPPGTQEIFGALNPTQLWQSVNASADYPLSGQIMQAMYQEVTGIHVNGVIGIDVPALVSLLRLSGPVVVPGITVPVSADNAADVLLHQLYAQFPAGDQTQRHDDISAVARAVIDKMKTEHVDLAAFAVALANDVSGRHLLAWDENPAFEATIVKTGGSGAIDTSHADRTFHLSVQSATAAKLDYFVTTGIRMVVTIDGHNNAVVHTYATVANHAPAGQPPSAQLGPDNINSFTPGQYVTRVYLWSPSGSQTNAGVAESGLVLNRTATSVLAQQSQTVDFTTVIPNAVRHGQLYLQVVPQPSLYPAAVSVQVVGGPDWNVVGPSYLTASLVKTLGHSWTLSPR
ncbi:MAG TPA: DUF4012 domain-containing protein [Acidimicrobiales bacterium]|jgi:hypothetical protein|nr:DUF4012 domain-containing protein [Acidimicrobiales bacterium]